MKTVDVALFPIPNCVVFPGTEFPLHVFEPRYRTMVKQCAETGLLLGVCHVEKLIKPSKPGQTMEEALNTNQATYKPLRIFSAGRCRIDEILNDGRLRVTLQANVRLQALEPIQTLPFSIYRCHHFEDLPETSENREKSLDLKDKVQHRLIAMLGHLPGMTEMLQSPGWVEKTPTEYSFDLFQFLRLETDLQQRILESRTSSQRLTLILDILNQAGRPVRPAD